MNTNEFLKEFYKEYPIRSGWMVYGILQENRPVAVCADGFGVSIQASENHYCSPRMNGRYVNYTEVELGFPSREEELIKDYAEDDDYTNTVYGYVPVELVDQVLEKHGGIVGVKYGYNPSRDSGRDPDGVTYFDKK